MWQAAWQFRSFEFEEKVVLVRSRIGVNEVEINESNKLTSTQKVKRLEQAVNQSMGDMFKMEEIAKSFPDLH